MHTSSYPPLLIVAAAGLWLTGCWGEQVDCNPVLAEDLAIEGAPVAAGTIEVCLNEECASVAFIDAPVVGSTGSGYRVDGESVVDLFPERATLRRHFANDRDYQPGDRHSLMVTDAVNAVVASGEWLVDEYAWEDG